MTLKELLYGPNGIYPEVRAADVRRLLKVERIPFRAWPEGYWMKECVERTEGELFAKFVTQSVRFNIPVNIEVHEQINLVDSF